MAASSTITLDELLAEYERLGLNARGNEVDGLTVNELAARWGISSGLVRRRLQTAAGAGMLRVGRRPVTDLAGRPTSIPVYAIDIPKQKGGKK